MNRLLIILGCALLAACGGGGGGDSAATDTDVDSSGGCLLGGSSLPLGSVSIQTMHADLFSFVEVAQDVYETESPTVTLSGGVLEQTHDTVTVRNETTGESMAATGTLEWTAAGCAVGHWTADPIDLAVGSNTLVADDTNDTDEITIRRIIDTTAPVVTSELPASGSVDAATNTVVRATFSDFMDAATLDVTTVILTDPTGIELSGAVTFDAPAREVTFDPDSDLLPSTTFTARITTGVTDDAGNPMATDHVWSFATADNGSPPAMVLARPAEGDVCVLADAAIEARFDEPLLPSSLSSTTVTVEDAGGAQIAGTIAFVDETLTFGPDVALNPGESYTVNLNNGITDIAGLPLAPESWSFTTEYAPEGTWTAISPSGLGGREDHSAVWTGSEMLIFGGHGGSTFAHTIQLGFDPATDQWRQLSDINATHSRWQHSATWTGTEMIIWGGRDWNAVYSSGGRYNPATDTWAPVSDTGKPAQRYDHTAVWTGTELIIWGGRRLGQQYNDGARYDPATDTWTPVSIVNAPQARDDHAAVWDGTHMIVWGGESDIGLRLRDGAMYDPVTDTWSPLPTQDAPDPMQSGNVPPAIVSTGVDMFLWNHFSEFEVDPWTNVGAVVPKSEGLRLESTSGWQRVAEPCDSQAAPNAAWLAGRLISFNSDLTDAYTYDESRDTWIPAMPFAGDAVTGASVVATDDSIIVFGGDGTVNLGLKDLGYRITF